MPRSPAPGAITYPTGCMPRPPNWRELIPNSALAWNASAIMILKKSFKINSTVSTLLGNCGSDPDTQPSGGKGPLGSAQSAGGLLLVQVYGRGDGKTAAKRSFARRRSQTEFGNERWKPSSEACKNLAISEG